MPRGINTFDQALIERRNFYQSMTSNKFQPNLRNNRFIPSGNNIFTQPNDIVSNGLVFYLDAGITNSYPQASSTWYDLSGNNNNGLLINAPTYSSENDGLLSFNGTNQQTNVIDPAALRNQNFSISLWIRPRTQAAAVTTIIDFNHGLAPFQGWVMQSEDATTNRNYYFVWYDGSNYVPASGAGKGIQITNNVWQNITYTKNGTTLIGYKNGASVYTPTPSGSATVVYTTGKNVTIANSVSFTRFFNSDIGNVMIYNKGLSLAEVVQNYNAQRTGFGV